MYKKKTMPRETRKNRMNELKRVQSELSNKQKFKVVEPTTVIPGQAVRLFSDRLITNYAGIHLKETNPREYLKQRQKIQAKKNLNTRKYNKPKRGSGSHGSGSTTTLEWMKRLGW